MRFQNKSADTYVPSDLSIAQALGRTTHLGIGAHQDDLEIMAYHGIAACYESTEKWFSGVICTDGAGSARTGRFAAFTDDEMRKMRREEQRKASVIGRYSAVMQLDYPSSAVKKTCDEGLKKDLVQILEASAAQQIYLHSPADKHATHLGVFTASLAALRELPPGKRPKYAYGCEVWRDLDWLPDDDKVVLDVSRYPELAQQLIEVFESQIAGGKRYDRAMIGRRYANATYLKPHLADGVSQAIFALDLMPLISDPTRDVADYVLSFIDRFRATVRDALGEFKK